jgi:pimeloyl-ACP methyl ester carboxylesterase
VTLHGFPDNHHIYDPLDQFLANAGRHVVAFDFLGFGSSDKPEGYIYNYDQQLADLDAVVNHLKLSQIVPVGHDSGGFVAINYLLAHPERIAHLCLLNTFYTNTTTLRPPGADPVFRHTRSEYHRTEDGGRPGHVGFPLDLPAKPIQSRQQQNAAGCDRSSGATDHRAELRADTRCRTCIRATRGWALPATRKERGVAGSPQGD